MRIGDASRARRFANPARLRWYAFHRSVRFALRMMKPDPEITPATLLTQMPCLGFSLEAGRGIGVSEETGGPMERDPN
jgi:hypothetical protein